jgi:hypothetical protein
LGWRVCESESIEEVVEVAVEATGGGRKPLY